MECTYVCLRLGSKTDVVFYADLWFYHLDRNEWEQLFPTVTATVPCKRYGHTLTAVDNRVYLYGGFVTEGLTSARLNDLWELNPGTSLSSCAVIGITVIRAPH